MENATRRTRQKPIAAQTGDEPAPTRPHMPDVYYVKGNKNFVAWSRVEQQMAASRNYWIGTTRPDRRPHVIPVWGVWLDRVFYFSTDRRSRKARNLQANPTAAVHLESGDDVIILECQAEEITSSPQIKAVNEAYKAKYKMPIIGMPGDVGIYALRPRVVLAWQESDFGAATRWLIDETRSKKRRKRV
jgi:pyridoxine/pyridoxamine 5'-phosphate oxidase